MGIIPPVSAIYREIPLVSQVCNTAITLPGFTNTFNGELGRGVFQPAKVRVKEEECEICLMSPSRSQRKPLILPRCRSRRAKLLCIFSIFASWLPQTIEDFTRAEYR
jgi:hypothetical protein